MHRLARDFLAAVMLLTRLPVPSRAGAGDPRAAVWAYPVVGLLVGGAGAAVDWAALGIGLPPFLAAIWTVAAMAALTGALHEDGLADAADGFGAGGDAARILAIMRDSRIGSFGALALILSVAARVAAIGGTAHPFSALLAAGVTGRAAMIILLLVLKPARSDGLAAGLRGAFWWEGLIGLGIAGGADWLLLPPATAFWVTVSTVCAALALARFVRLRVGGHTGDILGAAEQIAEVMTLTLVSSG